MKTSSISQTSKNVLGAIALLVGISLSPVQAQTFTGENKIKEDPAVIPAVIYPTTNPQIIRVNVDLGTRPSGPLKFVIRDGKGKTKHKQTIYVAKYKGGFDLSLLGNGTYTFELSNQAGQTYTRTFRIETPEARVIALGDPLENSFKLAEKLESTGH